MTAAMYESAVARFSLGDLNWENDTVKVLLADDRYEPDQAADESRADLSLGEVAASGSYRAGGAMLGGRTVVRSDAGGVVWTGGTVRWSGFTGEFRWAVLYRPSGSEDRSNDHLIAYVDLGVQQVSEAVVEVGFVNGVAVFSAVAA